MITNNQAVEELDQLKTEVEAVQPATEDKLSTYSVFDVQFQEMLKDWDKELMQTNEQRFFRYIEVDVQKMRRENLIKDDETILPVRVADRNIRREQPSYISFATQSRRSLIFRERQRELSQATGSSNEQRIEEEFTQGMRYPGWELPIYAATDGSQTHGWDAVEIVYDETKPLKVAIEHVGHDKLLFPVGAVDIQYSDYYARGYDVTGRQLKDWVKKFGFDEKQVKCLLEADDNTGRRTTRMYRVWKIVFREDDKIKVAWRCDSPIGVTMRQQSAANVCSDWLKAPTDLYLGRQELQMVEQPPAEVPVIDPATGLPMLGEDGMPMTQLVAQPPIETLVDVPETEFPAYILRYHMTERQHIFDTRGRVFLDRYDQEAQTAVVSGFVNKLMRSTNVYAAVNSDPTPGSSAPPKQLPVKLEHGAIYDRPTTFFSSDAPEAILLNALQFFSVRNADENGQTDFAVNNREDSRKTATEIQAAQQQAGLLSGVQVTLYSAWLCSIYKRCWEVVQSMALIGKIPFLSSEQDESGLYQNDVAVVGRDYYVRAAGDIDVTQRAEQIQRMGQMWPIVANTPLAMDFLKELLMVSFPLDGLRWSDALAQADQTKQLLAAVAGMLEKMIMSRPEELKQLSPEEQQQLMALKQQVATVLGGQNAAQ